MIVYPRWQRLLLATDQWFNVLMWGGSQDETISSHIGRRIRAGKAYWIEKCICDILCRIEAGHCKKALGE